MSDKKNTPTENKSEEGKKVSLNPKQITQLYQAERKKAITIRRRVQNVEAILLETIAAKQILEEIKNGKANEMMVPIGAGYFMSASRKSDATLLKSMAGNVMMPVDTKEAIDEASKNEETARKQLESLQKEQQSTLVNLSQLENAMALISQQREMAKAKQQAKESETH